MKKRYFIFIIVLILFLFPTIKTSVYSQATPTPVEYALPYPGILPDHPLYFLKNIRDKILLLFNRKPEKKIEILLLLADKKLVMGQLLMEEKKIDLAKGTIVEAEAHFLSIVPLLLKMKDENIMPTNLIDKLELSLKKHNEVISSLQKGLKETQQTEIFQEALNTNKQANAQILSLK